MTENRIITQICIVVRDVRQANSNWAKILGVPEEKIETIFPDGILHYTHGEPAQYKDCRVAKYQLDNFVLGLIQPGRSPSPWRAFLEKKGQGVFLEECLSKIERVFNKRSQRSALDFRITLAIFRAVPTAMLHPKNNWDWNSV